MRADPRFGIEAQPSGHRTPDVTVRTVHVALLWHPFPPAMPEWHALAVREPFLAVGLLGMCVTLGLAMSFWKLAPAASMALVGGLAGATAGLVGWVFVPENLQQLDLIDGGIQASYGDGLPAAARGFSLGIVLVGLVSLRLARAPTGFPAALRRASVGVLAGGVGLAWVVRTLLDGECARLGTQSCSETLMVAGSIILDAVVVGILLLVAASASAPFALRQRGAAHPARR